MQVIFKKGIHRLQVASGDTSRTPVAVKVGGNCTKLRQCTRVPTILASGRGWCRSAELPWAIQAENSMGGNDSGKAQERIDKSLVAVESRAPMGSSSGIMLV